MARGPAAALFRAYTRKRNAYGRAKACIFDSIFPELSPAGVEVGRGVVSHRGVDFTRSLCNFNSKGRSYRLVSSIFDAGNFSARSFSSESESGEESSNVKDECAAPEFDYNVDAGSLGADGVCDERDGWKKAASAVIDEKEPDEDVWNDDFEDVVESDEGKFDFEKAALLDPVELYKEMISSETGANKTRQEWDVMVQVFKYFVNSGWASNQALAIYIGKSFFPTAVSQFQAFGMLGISYGEWFVIMGAAAALIGPKDLLRIARTLGRLAGRSIGYVQMARGQLDSVMQQSQARQVHKELQDTMSQLEAIRHEIRGLSMLNPGPVTKSFMENTLDSTDEADAASKGPEKRAEDKSLPKVPKAADSVVESSVTTKMVSQATAYARLAEAAANAKMKSAAEVDKQYDDAGLLSVLPVSAESAGLLPKLKGSPQGSDILLEAIIEADVAHNAKDFFSQPQNQIPRDRE